VVFEAFLLLRGPWHCAIVPVRVGGICRSVALAHSARVALPECASVLQQPPLP